VSNLTKPAGYPYALKDPVPHGELNEICEQYSKAPNLDEGSSHTPTGTVDIDGSSGGGFTFTNNAIFDGFLEVLSLTIDAAAAGAVGFTEKVEVYVEKRLEMLGNLGAAARFVLGARSRFNCVPYNVNDADLTINLTEASPILILDKPTAVRTLTLEQATDTQKENGDFWEIYMPIPPTDDADYWQIKREGSANNICVMQGKYDVGATAPGYYPAFCKIYLKAGVWRLAGGAGINWDTDA
jgi:hypothetical protein